jgi:hypothetical protein
VAGPSAEEFTVSMNKDHLRAAGPPQHEVCAGGGTDWPDLDDVLEELGLSLRQFRAVYPHVGLEHRGRPGQVIIDANQLEEGGCP